MSVVLEVHVFQLNKSLLHKDYGLFWWVRGGFFMNFLGFA